MKPNSSSPACRPGRRRPRRKRAVDVEAEPHPALTCPSPRPTPSTPSISSTPRSREFCSPKARALAPTRSRSAASSRRLRTAAASPSASPGRRRSPRPRPPPARWPRPGAQTTSAAPGRRSRTASRARTLQARLRGQRHQQRVAGAQHPGRLGQRHRLPELDRRAGKRGGLFQLLPLRPLAQQQQPEPISEHARRLDRALQPLGEPRFPPYPQVNRPASSPSASRIGAAARASMKGADAPCGSGDLPRPSPGLDLAAEVVGRGRDRGRAAVQPPLEALGEAQHRPSEISPTTTATSGQRSRTSRTHGTLWRSASS